MTKVAEVIAFLEQTAPNSLQESYDNAGLICGNPQMEVTNVLVSLDTIESTIDEAIATNANLVVGHHPIVFSGLKSITGKNYIERTLIKAIKNDIAIYAIHTNLDNVLRQGVNEELARRLGLTDYSILATNRNQVRFEINASSLLKPELSRDLQAGLADSVERFGVRLDMESELTVTGPAHIEGVVARVCHTYKTTYQKIDVQYSGDVQIGAGLVASLPLPMTEQDFLAHIKDRLGLDVIRHTALLGQSVQKVALCGGSGSFLLPQAIGAGADFFITADYKYHQFFDADGRIVIADVGHFESEQYTIHVLKELISGKFSNFAARCVKTDTNPVHYYK